MEDLICARLEALRDEKYRAFTAKLIPNVCNVLGVRTPLLRKLARELVKDASFDIKNFLRLNTQRYMEFTLLQAFVIGLRNTAREEFFFDVKNFVPKINNWAVCDGFCSSLKLVNTYKSEFFDFLQLYLDSEEEYELRFGVVMLLDYYITEEYIDRVLNILVSRRHDGYYAQMAIAWALSMCYVKFFDKTHTTVLGAEIQPSVLKKTIRKVCESLQSTESQRQLLRELLVKN